ncbi:uncharacterized protein LOC132550426 [Ylistrum balloti]|uniref:uncharacterized protein LOC132550426 n=1 Tax=Ylistrum balloti TaxID=509963 RepID=UPI0029059FC0|nr:uncharacterized protein LOC132550426 [Ylistrum balloti]
MRMTMLLLLMMMIGTTSRVSGFYIIEPSVLSSDKTFFQISSNDILSLTGCEKKITFEKNEDISLTYMNRSHLVNFMPISDAFLELTALDSNGTQDTFNISGKTPNMTQYTLHGTSVTIRVHPNYCNQYKTLIMNDFLISISVTKTNNLCQDPGTPENSIRREETSEFVIGTNIQFSCRRGYVISGSKIISCVRDPDTGIPSWTGSNPTCVRQCEKPPAPKFGGISQITPNGSAHFTCESPFTLVGPEMITCLHNGAKTNWNDSPPKCIVTTCPANGTILSVTYKNNFIATPGFPGNLIYSNLTCKWVIQLKADNACIHLYFETFDIPNSVVFEIYKYVEDFAGDGDLVWSSRSADGLPMKTFIICSHMLRLSYASGEMDVTGHRGVQMWYLARPISEYHAAYQRAGHLGYDDQISVEPTKATGQMEADDSSHSNVAGIAAGVSVTVVLLIIGGIVFYIWYRKKYPVRMIIGKDFGKFTNPVYNKSTSTATLTRPDSFEREIKKMATEKFVSHENHVDLSDEQEYQPTSGLTLLGSLGMRAGLDDFDSPEMKKRNNTKQRKKSVPANKIVIEEEEEEVKDEITNISDTSSETSSTSGEKSSASDENSDGEGFRPVTDAPKVKRKRVSAYLNEALDRKNSQDSTDTQDGSEVIQDKETISDGIDKVVDSETLQQIDEDTSSIDHAFSKDELSSDLPKPNESDHLEQNERNEHVQGETSADRPKIVLTLGIKDFKFTDEDEDESGQSSSDTDEKAEKISSVVQKDDIVLEDVKDITLSTEEIMTEVNNLSQQEAQPATESTVQSEPTTDIEQLEHTDVLTQDIKEQFVQEENDFLTYTEKRDATSDDKMSDGKESIAIGVSDISVTPPTLIEKASITELNSEHNFTDVLNTAPALLEDTKEESVNRPNHMVITHPKISDTQTDNDVVSSFTAGTPEALEHNQDIIGYLTRDEMRELTARTKSFGEDSLSSVYSGELVSNDNPVAEIAEQDFSSGVSLDETDSPEIPFKNKVEVQFERIIQDLENYSPDFTREDDDVEDDKQEDIIAKADEPMTSFDPTSLVNISNDLSGETSDFLPLADRSDDDASRTLNVASSAVDDFLSFENNPQNQFFSGLSLSSDTNIFTEKSSTHPITLVMSGFDTGESSTDVQNHVDVLKIVPNDQLSEDSSGEDDSDDSKISNKDVIEYTVNPGINAEDSDDDDDDDHDQMDELQLISGSFGKGKRKSITLENPSFDSLDFSKFQQNTLNTGRDDTAEESDSEVPMKAPAIGRRESVSLDNPLFDTEPLPESSNQREKMRVIAVSNLLATPPTSSNESSSEDSESEPEGMGEYVINPSTDPEDTAHKTDEIERQPGSDLPVGVMNFLSMGSKSELENAIENSASLTMPLDYDPRKKQNLESVESDVSSLDSATVKEIEELSSDSEASNKDNAGAFTKANTPAQKKFSLSSISRKLKSSFKTTTKPDLQSGDNDMVDV